MRKKQGIIVSIIALFWLPPTLASGVEIHNLNEAVNIAGRQRMYTMRMLRDYTMIGEKLTYKKPADDLKKIQKNFQEAYESLVAFVKDPTLSDELKQVGARWDAVQTIMKKPPKKEEASSYFDGAMAFRKDLNAFVEHLAKSQKKATAQVVNVSGRMRAISQALAAIYQLRAWGMPHAEEKIKVTMKLFRQGLDYLNKAKETQPPMRAILKDLEKTYLFFDFMNQSKVFTPTLVIKKTDAMLHKASKLTELYVQSTH